MADPWVERYKREVLPKLTAVLKPRRVLLFGSRVSGNARPDSDLDVIIVSETFAAIPFVRRMAYVLSITRFPKHVDYLCYTREEFERIKDTSSIVHSALAEHTELAATA